MEQWRLQVRQILGGFARTFYSTRDQHRWHPADGSPAADALAQEGTFAGTWSDEPVADLLALVALQATSAAEHLEAMVRLLDDEPMAFAPATVARSVLEASARSWWLLDPDLGVDERIQRGMTERLHGLWENEKHPGQGEAGNKWARKTARILTEAERRGQPFEVATDRRPPCIGARRPSSTWLIGEVIGRDDLGAMFYRHLSGTAHATTSLAHAVDPEAVPSTGIGHLVVRADLVLLQATGASLAYAQAVDRLCAFYGWDPTMWAKWSHHGIRTLLAMMRAVPATAPVVDPDDGGTAGA